MRELQTVVTFLEMKAESIHHVAAPANLKLMLLRAENITLDFYRFLYDAVGRNFNWYDRRYFTDAKLAAAIHAEGVEVWVLYVGGQPAGYFELVPREDKQSGRPKGPPPLPENGLHPLRPRAKDNNRKGLAYSPCRSELYML
jgi:hypothetical protein